jgi:hypothetical protein
LLRGKGIWWGEAGDCEPPSFQTRSLWFRESEVSVDPDVRSIIRVF